MFNDISVSKSTASVARSVGGSVSRSVGRCLGRSVAQSFARSLGRSVAPSLGCRWPEQSRGCPNHSSDMISHLPIRRSIDSNWWLEQAMCRPSRPDLRRSGGPSRADAPRPEFMRLSRFVNADWQFLYNLSKADGGSNSPHVT